jgi:hypothetical protein
MEKTFCPASPAPWLSSSTDWLGAELAPHHPRNLIGAPTPMLLSPSPNVSPGQPGKQMSAINEPTRGPGSAAPRPAMLRSNRLSFPLRTARIPLHVPLATRIT